MATVGIKALRKIQMGQEDDSTPGTAVAATFVWRGLGVMENMADVIFPEEDVGYLSGTDRTYIPKLGAKLAMPDIEATFEQLPVIFEAGIAQEVATQDDSGTGYIYAYAMPTTAQNSINTYTIETGDNIQAEEMEHSFVEGFKLSGKAGEAMMISADWVGRQVSTCSFTGALTPPVVEEILTSKGKLYIDDDSDTIGTTQISESILEYSLSVKTGLKAIHTADGQRYFTFVKCSGEDMDVVLDVTFEHDTTSVAQKAVWLAETPKQIRFIVEGSTLALAGNYTYKTLTIDLAGKWEKFPPLGDQDGDNVLTGTFRARYNSDAALFAEFVVVNALTVLP